jgi:hypothetical protein
MIERILRQSLTFTPTFSRQQIKVTSTPLQNYTQVTQQLGPHLVLGQQIKSRLSGNVLLHLKATLVFRVPDDSSLIIGLLTNQFGHLVSHTLIQRHLWLIILSPVNKRLKGLPAFGSVSFLLYQLCVCYQFNVCWNSVPRI